jgi:predicted DNA-binding ribbon-helix-helix protein
MNDDIRPKKRSLNIKGHRTSVSLEEPFWDAFIKLAKIRQQSLNSLASKIDESRDPRVGLATAIRVFCLQQNLSIKLPKSG